MQLGPYTVFRKNHVKPVCYWHYKAFAFDRSNDMHRFNSIIILRDVVGYQMLISWNKFEPGNGN